MLRIAKQIAAIGLMMASSAALAQSPRLELSLLTQTDLAVRDNREREPFYFQVAKPLVANGRVIVPAGAIAVGEIVAVSRSDHFAREGEMAVRLLYVSAPAGPIKLTPASGDAALVVVSSRDGLMHPAGARLHVGTPVTAYLTETPTGGQAMLSMASR